MNVQVWSGAGPRLSVTQLEYTALPRDLAPPEYTGLSNSGPGANGIRPLPLQAGYFHDLNERMVLEEEYLPLPSYDA